jgi:3-hydroxyisobutyrate dehydrogenase-like beta-hydroxyacid dehydrogenase
MTAFSSYRNRLHIVAHRVAAAVQAGTLWVNGYRTIHVSVPFGGFAASGSFDSGFTAGLMRKDLRLALELAGRVGGTGTLMQEVGRVWLQASAAADGADFNRGAAALWQAEKADE